MIRIPSEEAWRVELIEGVNAIHNSRPKLSDIAGRFYDEDIAVLLEQAARKIKDYVRCEAYPPTAWKQWVKDWDKAMKKRKP
jgi:hypothetical protein